MNKMPCHITDLTDPDDRPEVDEEIRDSLEIDLVEILYGIARTIDELKDYPFARKQA